MNGKCICSAIENCDDCSDANTCEKCSGSFYINNYYDGYIN